MQSKRRVSHLDTRSCGHTVNHHTRVSSHSHKRAHNKAASRNDLHAGHAAPTDGEITASEHTTGHIRNAVLWAAQRLISSTWDTS